MKKIFFLLIILLPILAVAQEPAPTTTSDEAEKIEPQVEAATIASFIKAEGGEDQVVEVGKKINFSAKDSAIEPKDLDVNYVWDFGDGSTDEGEKVAHTYEESGEYTISLIITAKESELSSTDIFKVSAYNDLVLFITDRSEFDPELSRILSRARRQGVSVRTINPKPNANDFMVADQLKDEILANIEEFDRAGIIITWTKNNFALPALAKLDQLSKKNEELDFRKKIIVAVTKEELNTVTGIGQNIFSSLRPKYVIVAQEEIISTVIDAHQADKLISLIQTTNAKHLILGTHSQRLGNGSNFFNFSPQIVNFMINKGVPLESLLLTLMLPIVVTLIALARQIFGIKAFGIYTPTIVALSFVATGLKYGLAIFLIIIVTGTLSRLLLKKIRLLHIPKVAIVLTVVSLAVLVMLAEGSLSSRTGLISVSLFPMLIMITLVEKFVNVQVEKGFRTAVIISTETLFLSIVSYYIVNWQSLRMLVLSYPEIIFLTILVNIILGKWTGLTLAEYFRFREVIKEVAINKKSKN